MRVLVGEVAAVERVDDEGLVAEVDDPGDAVARLQGRHGAGDELVAAEVVHGAVVVAVFHVLKELAIKPKVPSDLAASNNGGGWFMAL